MTESIATHDDVGDPWEGRHAVASLVGAAGALGTAWSLQAAGYAPCELCLVDRIPLYLALPLGVAAILGPRRLRRAWLGWLALCFAAGAAIAGYHAGVEAHLWAGPGSCTGRVAMPASVADLRLAIASSRAARCDVPAIRIAGLSLAAWDGIACCVLAAIAATGTHRWRRSRR